MQKLKIFENHLRTKAYESKQFEKYENQQTTTTTKEN